MSKPDYSAIGRVEEHNRWRRGEGEMQPASQLSADLDQVCLWARCFAVMLGSGVKVYGLTQSELAQRILSESKQSTKGKV